jgi:hypothetical protein
MGICAACAKKEGITGKTAAEVEEELEREQGAMSE